MGLFARDRCLRVLCHQLSHGGQTAADDMAPEPPLVPSIRPSQFLLSTSWQELLKRIPWVASYSLSPFFLIMSMVVFAPDTAGGGGAPGAGGAGVLGHLVLLGVEGRHAIKPHGGNS